MGGGIAPLLYYITDKRNSVIIIMMMINKVHRPRLNNQEASLLIRLVEGYLTRLHNSVRLSRKLIVQGINQDHILPNTKQRIKQTNRLKRKLNKLLVS